MNTIPLKDIPTCIILKMVVEIAVDTLMQKKKKSYIGVQMTRDLMTERQSAGTIFVVITLLTYILHRQQIRQHLNSESV